MLDPRETIQAARDAGEPQLAEWMQREVDRQDAVARKFEIQCWLGLLALGATAVAIWYFT